MKEKEYIFNEETGGFEEAKMETNDKEVMDWKKEFDKKFVDNISGDMWQTTSREDIKTFIESLLHTILKQQREICAESPFYKPDYIGSCYCEVDRDIILNAPEPSKEK